MEGREGGSESCEQEGAVGKFVGGIY